MIFLHITVRPKSCIPEEFVELQYLEQMPLQEFVDPRWLKDLKEAALTIVQEVLFPKLFCIYSKDQKGTLFYLPRHLDRALNSMHEELRHQVSCMQRDYVDKVYIDRNSTRQT
jgi:hypothetical protein